MKTMIAIPCLDTVPVSFVESLMRMDKPENTSVCFHKNSLTYDSRNILSLRAIQEDFDYVLWIDSDIIVPQNALVTLLDDMQTYDTRMVSGLYVMRSFPVHPVIYSRISEPTVDSDGIIHKHIRVYDNYPKNLTFDIDGCGFGCVLTDVSLLKKVWERFGPAFSPLPWATEDLSFCHRVNQIGDQIMCDSNVSCGHVGHMIYTDALIRGGDAGETN